MHVHVNFTLNIDPAEWDSRNGTAPISPTQDGDDAAELRMEARIAREVRAHAENVVRDLFADMGWTVEEPNA